MVTEQDNPNIYPGVIPPDMKKRVAFNVLNTIDIIHWGVKTYDTNSDLVATLQLDTPSGSVAFHNVYNRNNELDVDQLFEETCMGTGTHVLLGDFNLHHRSWGGDQMTCAVEPKGEQLYYAVTGARMKLLSERGAITYSRGTQLDQNCSTIDLVFGSSAIVSREPAVEHR